MASPKPPVKHVIGVLKDLHPALFGDYGMDHVTVGSIGTKLPHLPRVTLGVGAVQSPSVPIYGRLTNTGAHVVPGLTLRIGGEPDRTEPLLHTIGRGFKSFVGKR